MYHVGVDVGKAMHHVSVRNTSSDGYSKPFSIANDRNGFVEFVATLEKLSLEKSDFLIGVEACSYAINLSYFLMKAGYNLVEVNPFRAAQFRKAQGRKAKTDKIDARSIAAIISLGDHKALSVPDPIMDNLKDLTRFRAGLVVEKASMITHLKEALSVVFPEYEKVFRQPDSSGSLALLAAFPGPESVIAAGEQVVGMTLSIASPRRMGRGMALRIIEAAKSTVGVIQKQPAVGTKISILAKRITSLQSTIREIDEQIDALFEGLPCKLQGFPLGSVHTLAAIVSEIGDINMFSTLKKFLSHLGWCPQSFQTGSFRLDHPKMSHAGNKYIRHIIWMMSLLAIRMVPHCKEYFRRRVTEGKAKMHILIAVGRKLLSALYAMLKKGVPYDPNWGDNSQIAMARR